MQFSGFFGQALHGAIFPLNMANGGQSINASYDGAINESGCEIVIPPKKNRKSQREYDKDIYRVRHLVENAFLHLKRWRGIATRYAKALTSFAAAVQIRCIALWFKALALLV
jgi:Transposase and inactivated derivatives